MDIGTQTLAVCAETDVKIHELADRAQRIENEKRLIQRKMDRSKRATNPDNFNPDGTIKKQGSKKVEWNWSKRYLKCRDKLHELYRKQAAIRKLQHEEMANSLLPLGNKFFVETMDFKALHQRKPKLDKDGKPIRKKQFGKSIAHKAPAKFIDILERKLIQHGAQLYKLDKYEPKASQYKHTDQTYKKKKLGQRWNNINGKLVQRDMYSAFLIMNANDDLKTFNQVKCDERYENFLRLHDLEVQRLLGQKNLSSIAI